MSDIVERLRGLHVTRHPSRSVIECDEITVLEAAAEIEQLRAALREYVCECKGGCEADNSFDIHWKCGDAARAALAQEKKG